MHVPTFGSYDPVLTGLSAGIAVLASYTALDLGGRLRGARGWPRLAWLAAAGVAMGGGIWSVHLIAILACRLPVAIAFDPGSTLASLGSAVAFTALALAVVGGPRASLRHVLLGGALMGSGLATMHYTDMLAIHGGSAPASDMWLAVLSVVFVLAAATLALWLACLRRTLGMRLLGALAMGSAIAAMHYLAMEAADFRSLGGTGQDADLGGPAPSWLALAVSGTAFAVLLVSLAVSLLDRRLAALADREAAALRDSEARFRTLYRGAPVPLHSAAPDGRLAEVSDVWLRLLRYRREEVLGRRLSEFMDDASARHWVAIDWPHVLGAGAVHELECTFIRRDGAAIEALLSCTAERDAQGRLLRTIGALVDVTARKRAEAAFAQAQKMEAVGQLTGGLAHDFNNLLSVVLGNLEMAGAALDDAQPEEARASLALAREGAERAAELTRRLLAVARRQDLRPRPTNVDALVAGMKGLVRSTLGPAVALRTVRSGRPWTCSVDPHLLESALLNLIINARDAMPHGGSVRIETANVTILANPEATMGAVAPGEHVRLRVTDTGCGMSPEVAAHAFEPFFTTKPAGQGTGLGLAQVFGFVRQSGGHVALHSAPGQGTTVEIHLPRLVRAEEAAGPGAILPPPGEHPGMLTDGAFC